MSSSLRQLQTLLDFNDSDLNANRRGHLSKSQIEALQLQATQELKLLLLIPTLVIAWLLLSLDLAIALPAVFIISCLIAGAVALHRDHLKTYKLKPICKISGVLSKKPLPGKLSRSQFMFHIGNEHLAVERHLYEGLPEGKYTLYMLNDKILSMEPLRSSASNSTTRSEKHAAKAARKSTATKSARNVAIKKPTALRSTSATAKKTSATRPAPKKSSTKTAIPAFKLAKASGKATKKPLPLTRTRESMSANRK
jgi:hypothetical protein